MFYHVKFDEEELLKNTLNFSQLTLLTQHTQQLSFELLYTIEQYHQQRLVESNIHIAQGLTLKAFELMLTQVSTTLSAIANNNNQYNPTTMSTNNPIATAAYWAHVPFVVKQLFIVDVDGVMNEEERKNEKIMST